MAYTKTSRSAPGSDINWQVHAPSNPVVEAAGIVCLAGLVIIILVMVGWVIAALSHADHDLSQTAASWVQAIGVPLTIGITVWGGFRQSRLDDEKKHRESRQQVRHDLQRRRSALVRLHWTVEIVAEKSSMPLNWLHDPLISLLGALREWKVAVKARAALEAFDFTDVSFHRQRSVRTMLDTMKLATDKVDKLAAEVELFELSTAAGGLLALNRIDRLEQLKSQFVEDERLLISYFVSSLKNFARDIEFDIVMLEYHDLYQKEATAEDVRPSSDWRQTSELEARVQTAPATAGVANPPAGTA